MKCIHFCRIIVLKNRTKRKEVIEMPAQNMGGLERITRVVAGLGLLLTGLFLLGGTTGSNFGMGVAVVGLFNLGTGASGFCLLYRVLHISTLRTSRSTAAK